MQPGRKFSAGSGYRYGFNGQEKDKENSGDGNSYTAEFWQYDSRIGRRWNIEPLTKKYPELSGYITFGDNPLLYADKDGEDKIITITVIGSDGTSIDVERRDKNYFHTYSDSKYSGVLDYYFKQDLSIHLVIDNSKGIDKTSEDAAKRAMADPEKYKVSSEYTNTQEIGFWEYHFPWAMPGDESGTEVADRWRVYGKNTDGSWNKGLPTAGANSESIDFGSVFDLLKNAKGPEKPIDLIKLIGNKAVQKIFKAADQITKAAEKIVKSIEVTKKNQVEQCESCRDFKKNGKKIDTTGMKIKPSDIKQVPIKEFHDL
jgi:hypothetical protein